MFDSDSEDVAYFEAIFALDQPEQPPAPPKRKCKVCKQPVYARDTDIHPGCGVELVSDEITREQREKHAQEIEAARQQRAYEKSIVDAARASGVTGPLKVCGGCHKAKHSATKRCDCGHVFGVGKKKAA